MGRQVHGGTGNDEIASGDGGTWLYGDAGTTTIPGGIPDEDAIYGGSGNDDHHGEQGDDYVDGGYRQRCHRPAKTAMIADRRRSADDIFGQ